MSRNEPSVEIREPAAAEHLPAGWVGEPILWDGRARVVVFDPQRLKVARFDAGRMDDDLRRGLGDAGWHHAGADGGGAELWVANRADLAVARLNRVREPSVDRAQIAVDTGDAREIAADWHGGQWSALYAFASTGTVKGGLEREIRECLSGLQSRHYSAEDRAREGPRLMGLLAYMDSRAVERTGEGSLGLT